MEHLELAEQLDGNQYGNEINEHQIQLAKDNGLVVVFGYSDDLVELEGAVCEELDASEHIRFLHGIPFFAKEPFEGDQVEAQIEFLSSFGLKLDFDIIKPVWQPENTNDASWAYETKIPCTQFRIMEDEGVYCIGMVFSINDLKD